MWEGVLLFHTTIDNTFSLVILEPPIGAKASQPGP
mgnify:CR=1 FL=1